MGHNYQQLALMNDKFMTFYEYDDHNSQQTFPHAKICALDHAFCLSRSCQKMVLYIVLGHNHHAIVISSYCSPVSTTYYQ